MIVNNNTATLETNLLETKTLNFSISDTRLVMEILSKLYAYPVRTLVQEYICNGRDAMREANTWGKKPIVIGVPNHIEPTFRVRDYGVGISPERMEGIFVNYGSSTKRNTNTQTGGFGIGAKSAFAYTDSFVIISYYNGVKYSYVAHASGENGGGVMQTGKESTTEDNGVEILIAVKQKDVGEFIDAVQRCVEYWTETIKFEGCIDGVIKQHKPNFTLGNIQVYDTPKGSGNTFYLIDGIQYECLGFVEKYYTTSTRLNTSDFSVAIVLPNGFFKIASSRERIENNDDNKAKAIELDKNVKKIIMEYGNKFINNKNLSLPDRIDNKNKAKGLTSLQYLDIDLGDFNLGSDCLTSNKFNFNTRYRYSTRRGVIKIEASTNARSVRTDDSTCLIVTENDTDDKSLVRRLNNLLLTTDYKELVIVNKLSDIPHAEHIFKDNILESKNIAKPKIVRTKGATTPNPRHGNPFVYEMYSHSKHKRYMSELTNHSLIEYDKDLYPLLELLTDIPRIMMVTIPKTHASFVKQKAKFITKQQLIHRVLVEARKECIGYHNTEVAKILKLNKITLPFQKQRSSMEILFKLDAKFKKEYNDNQTFVEEQFKKYPLLKVLEEYGLGHNSKQILIAEIKKQMEENK